MNDLEQNNILESITEGVFTIDNDFKITYFNRAAEQIIKIKREDALGCHCRDVLHCSLCEGMCTLKETLKTQKPIVDLSCFLVNNEGVRIPISISTAILRDAKGAIIGGAETFRDLSDVAKLEDQIKHFQKIGNFSSRSRSMRKIFSQLEAVAETHATVLITGDTGSGKELLARTLHERSPYAGSPFVAVNCGAFQDTLLESELFGYKKGAFTGADRDKAGRFALAENGTLFLDEIGEISPAMQVRLLRVLQEHVYEPLGAVKSSKTNARIIAATHRNLAQLVQEGKFRQDLYYRINVVQLELPPLRDRKEDIPFLVEHFIHRFNTTMNRAVSGISGSALKALVQFEWPGNIRELENTIERAMVFCRKEKLDVTDLPDSFQKQPMIKMTDSKLLRDQVRYFEIQIMLNTLEKCNGNRRKAAEILGVDHTTFYRKLQRSGVVLTAGKTAVNHNKFTNDSE
ncbi:MAG: sigma 54-interacting transcriptional regulator [Lentisphaeria bacterium]